MTIELYQSELEALNQQRMASGRFQNVEEVLLSTLKAAPAEEPAPQTEPASRSLAEAFAKAREIRNGEELDFGRNRSYCRPLDLS